MPSDTDWLETWSWPTDLTTRIAFGLGVCLLIAAAIPGGPQRLASAVGDRSLLDLGRRRRFLALAAAVAAFLSLGYVALYLQGGPRAPDAAVYWLQGRALSHGRLAWTAAEPFASFHTRGLLFPTFERESGSFPPGFPLLLAFGFVIGAPMVIGPLLAAAIVVATWWLARELAAAACERAGRVESVGRAAAGLSIVCVALRYHTAETLPFGAAALGVAVTLAATLRACRGGDVRVLAIAGVALGVVIAVHPLSAIPVGAAALALASSTGRGTRRAMLGAVAAAAPGAIFLLVAHHAETGQWFGGPARGEAASSIASLAAGPATPFAERALDVVRAHLLDVANFEPLALVALVGLLGSRRSRWAWWAASVIATQFAVAMIARTVDVAPGAGAGPLAPVLPVEHALVAFALARAFPIALERAAVAALGFAALGFASHASVGHQKMAASDVGRPHYEPDVAREGGVENGLLFFDDDVGYELARDPGVPASHGIEAVRLRGDDHDRLAYDILGHPPSHRYLTPAGRSAVTGWSPPGEGSDSWRFETESDWPPTSVIGGSVDAPDERGSCVSGGHTLRLTPAPGRSDATTVVELPVPRSSSPPASRTWVVTPRVFERGLGSRGTLALVTHLGDEPLAQWAWTDAAHGPSCIDLAPVTVELGGDRLRAWLVATAEGGAVAVDRTVLRAR